MHSKIQVYLTSYLVVNVVKVPTNFYFNIYSLTRRSTESFNSLSSSMFSVTLVGCLWCRTGVCRAASRGGRPGPGAAPGGSMGEDMERSIERPIPYSSKFELEYGGGMIVFACKNI